jgi:hypothetical protein
MKSGRAVPLTVVPGHRCQRKLPLGGHCGKGYATVRFFCEHEAGVIPDPEGMDLEDEPAALAQAMLAAEEIMRSNSLAGCEALLSAVLLVKDNAGATLFRMPFTDPGE